MALPRDTEHLMAASTASPFFRHVTLSEVTLQVQNLGLVVDFYTRVLGLREVASVNGAVGLSPTGLAPALIVLRDASNAPAAPAGAAGLFHVALLYPDRASLGRALARAVEAGVRLGGADHGVSEAIYLADPEGNGVELYRDRPPAEWPAAGTDGQVAMHSDPLDFQALVAAAADASGPLMPVETRIGHLHLRVSDLGRAERFYAGLLGFGVRQRDYPGALFFGRDGYHHHFGVNVWHSRRRGAPGTLGLASFTILLSPATFPALVDQLRIAGRIDRGMPGGVDVRDPDDIPIHVRLMGSPV